jgi:hypothetical protein
MLLRCSKIILQQQNAELWVIEGLKLVKVLLVD